MRFTIRDILWLTLIVVMGTAWSVDRGRQNSRVQALQERAGLEAIEYFPRDWDGRVSAFGNQNALLKFRVEALTRELLARGHRVEIDGCNVFVDRPLGIAEALGATTTVK